MTRQQKNVNLTWFATSLNITKLAALCLLTNNAIAQSAPTLNSFALSPSSVYVTEPFNLSWSSTNATSCLASTGETYDSSGNVTYPAGTLPVGNHTFTMYCQGPGGTSNTLSSSITIQAAPPVPVLHSFAFSPSTIYEDDSVQVSWSSSNATSCDVVGQGSYPASGSDTYPAYSFPVAAHTFYMTCSGAGGTSNTLTASLTVLEPLPSVPSVPGGLTTSDSSPLTGESYTISWNAVSGATSYQLRQNGTPSTTTATSQGLSQSNAGSYSYQVSACNIAGCSAQSSAITVSVSEPPPPPPVDLIGFDPYYTGYWPTSSSSNDLYIVRESTDGNNEGVTDFILVEQTGGEYSLNANPTPAQISQFNLSTPAAIAYELADMNLDGAVDMVLLDSSNIATGFVYAATNSQSDPIAYKHIDAEFIEFFEDLKLGLDDPSYYHETAKLNNWGIWDYGAVSIGWHWTDELFLSGQLFRGVEPFYTDVSQAFNPARPDWCDNPYPQSEGRYNEDYGIWQVYGIYQNLEFLEDYSLSDWNQDALQVAEPLMHYLTNESSAGIPSIVFAILEDILGVGHGLDDEPAIYNLAKLIEQMLFGFGADQQTKAPDNYAKVELIYTNPTSSMGMPVPLARHAYLLVTMPSGNIHATRGGPEDPPSYGSFGNIETEYALDPQDDGDFKDYGQLIKFRQLVGFTNLNSVTVGAILGLFSSSINSCPIEYKPFSQNSNSYAFQAAEAITATLRPVAQVWAPGYETFLICP